MIEAENMQLNAVFLGCNLIRTILVSDTTT